MNERYIKLQIESVVNKILYSKKMIEKNTYEQVVTKLDKLLLEESKEQGE